MNLTIDTFKTPDNAQEIIRIGNLSQLTGIEAAMIRKEIDVLKNADYNTYYLDASEVKHVDLSGINEVIHTNYTLQQISKKLVFVYRKNSILEKWVDTTGLNKFVEVALLPSN